MTTDSVCKLTPVLLSPDTAPGAAAGLVPNLIVQSPRVQSPRVQNPLVAYGGSWHADLSFRVSVQAHGEGSTRSVLSDNRHQGPLRLQKALYPEGPQPVHLLLLHPPGGLAAGDDLRLQGFIDAGAQCLVTTPGAGKFYKTDVPSVFHTQWELADGAGLECLPQESIVHDGAWASSLATFKLAQSARAVAAEILVLGRKSSGERFTRGEFRQHLSISRDSQLIFEDRNLWQPELMKKNGALGEHHVGALLWAARPEPWHEDEVTALEALLDAEGELCGVSQVVPGLILVRSIGSEVEAIRRLVHQAWAHLRPQVFQRQARLPRIWNT